MEPKLKTEINNTRDQEYWIACLRCGNETFHTVLVSAQMLGELPDIGYEWTENFEIVQCQGCRGLSARRSIWDCANPEEENTEIYPPRIAGRRDLPSAYLLPKKVRSIYSESLSALSNKLHILATIGARAIIETVCNDKGIKGKNLSQQIDNLVEQGVLTKDGSQILHNLRMLGNEAAHEVKAHTENDLRTIFDVIEHLLIGVYILPESVASLSSKK